MKIFKIPHYMVFLHIHCNCVDKHSKRDQQTEMFHIKSFCETLDNSYK